MNRNSKSVRTVSSAQTIGGRFADTRALRRRDKRSPIIKVVSGALLVALAAPVVAVDVREIELRRLFEPSAAEQQDEARGRVYIYDGLRDTDIERAMDQEFARIESMMFIRVKLTDEQGEVRKDPETGAELVVDDDC
jgi:hypothetical protein